WTLEHTSLKSFTYPVPETRFFHAGVNVYKFKIKYGNTIRINSNLDENIVSKELQVSYEIHICLYQKNAIRVVLGNLDNLCPFTTEHLIIFPSSKINVKTKKRNKFRENMDIEAATKQRRLEDILETSHTQHYVSRNLAENAIFMNTSQPNAEFDRTGLQKDVTYPMRNQSEETKYSCCSSVISTNGYNVKVLGQHTEINGTKNAENYKQERHMPASQNRSEQRMEMKKKGFLEYLK
ncbi:hypothetical protein E2320_010963, partial [Naja naja]